MEKTAYIYRITNTLNDMQYVGVTVNPKKRFRSHCRNVGNSRLLLKNAILKHGKEHFKMEILVKASQTYCYELESKVIHLYNTVKPNGYNLLLGGMGSLGLTGEMNGCYGRTGEKHPNFGKVGYRTGVTHSDEAKAKMSATRKGRRHSAETKAKMSAASKNNFSDQGYIQKMQQAGFCVGRPRKQRGPV